METFNFEAQCGAHISCSFNFEATLCRLIRTSLQVKKQSQRNTHWFDCARNSVLDKTVS